MQIKEAIIYRVMSKAALASAEAIEQALAKTPFAECGATQERSIGWAPPRGEEHGAMLEAVGGQWIAKFMTESKVLPSSVLARKVKEKAARIEKETGRKPGKKESKELKEEAKLDLLPMAFTRQAACTVWIDPEVGTIVFGTSVQSRADEMVSLLVKAIPGLSVALWDTASSPTSAMAHWLTTQEPPPGFSIDRECELKSADESKATIRYARHPLDIEEVQAHIAAGKLPTRLAMTFDDRVSFVLTEGMQLRSIRILDAALEGQGKDDGGFDADVAILTGELARTLRELHEALGGEAQRTIMEAAGDAPAPNVPAPHNSDTDGPDPLYDEAVKLVVQANKASISYVQRTLRVGYNRAARLLERMQTEEVVSAQTAEGQRQVLVSSSETPF